MKDEDWERYFTTELQRVLRTAREFDKVYCFTNARLIKIKLPTYIYKELVDRVKEVRIVEHKEEDITSYFGIYYGVPIEEDKDITNVQYVIEGYIKIL